MIIVAVIIALIVGGTLGAAAVFAWTTRRTQYVLAEQRGAQAVAEQRAIELDRLVNERSAEAQASRHDLLDARERLATATANLQSAQQRLNELRQEQAESQNLLRETFSSLSADALSKNAESFLQLANQRFASLTTAADGSLQNRKTEIEGLLKPLAEQLANYQRRLNELEQNRFDEFGKLKSELGQVSEISRLLSLQTGQLVTALRRPHSRGLWGEATLRRLVELAGMTNRCDFCEQVSSELDESRQRPDMLVQLPNGRQVVVDAKATLDAFLDAAGVTDEEARKTLLIRHASQVRKRAQELSLKAYWNQFAQSPEFVVMFLPGEAFLYAAVEHDPTLFEDFLKNHVIVATPTTLLALLKAIEFGWRQEQMASNAEEIRTLGKELYDRVATLMSHFSKLGSALDNSVKTYNDTLASLETRVLVSARKMGELGARSHKPIAAVEAIDRRARELRSLPENSAPASPTSIVENAEMGDAGQAVTKRFV